MHAVWSHWDIKKKRQFRQPIWGYYGQFRIREQLQKIREQLQKGGEISSRKEIHRSEKEALGRGEL